MPTPSERDAERLHTVEDVLALLIAWLERELGSEAVKQLLEQLDTNGEIGSRVSLNMRSSWNPPSK